MVDEYPDLDKENDVAVDIFERLLHTAEQRTTRDRRTIFFCRPPDLLAVLELLGIEQLEWSSIETKLGILQAIYNGTRTPAPKRG